MLEALATKAINAAYKLHDRFTVEEIAVLREQIQKEGAIIDASPVLAENDLVKVSRTIVIQVLALWESITLFEYLIKDSQDDT